MKKKNKRKIILFILLLLLLLAAATLLVRYENIRFQKSLYPLGYEEIVTREAKTNDLEPALVYSVILAESDFHAQAKSRAGAMGLMQLTPDTFDWLQKHQMNETVSFGSQPQKRPHDWSAQIPPRTVPTKLKSVAKQMMPYTMRESASAVARSSDAVKKPRTM